MAIVVRSRSKINLGLGIGGVRGDGFHGLVTVYQTLELFDLVTVEARGAGETRIVITSNDGRVPVDSRNTCWRMVEGALGALGVCAEVKVHIQKELPVQGGMGAGSANAAAALLGLERELGVKLGDEERMRVAAEVGSDVPLFLIGGAVFGEGRGEVVRAVQDIPATWCVIAVPEVGVSTPKAFKDWDLRASQLPEGAESSRIEELSRALAACYAGPGTSGILAEALPEETDGDAAQQDLAEKTLLALVRTGIGNDFEEVVFPQYPFLREIKRQLMGSESVGSAIVAGLSGSGSALFGLYRSEEDAGEAQRRVQSLGVKALITRTLPRAAYWSDMFAVGH